MGKQAKETASSRTVKPDGAAIARRRLERGWDVAALAGRVGCDVRTVTRLEKGESCYVQTLSAFAEALGLGKDCTPLLAAGTGPQVKVEKVVTAGGTVRVVLKFELSVEVSQPGDEKELARASQSGELAAILHLLQRMLPDNKDIFVLGMSGGVALVAIQSTPANMNVLGIDEVGPPESRKTVRWGDKPRGSIMELTSEGPRTRTLRQSEWEEMLKKDREDTT